MNKFESETELARIVVGWLSEQGYEVYQEVQTVPNSSVADIVATSGRKVVIVECKLSFGLKVIEQAFEWSHRAHLVYVAVPKANSRFAATICRHYGIGVLEVTPLVERILWNGKAERQGGEVTETIHPLFGKAKWAERWAEILTDKHKTYAEAGTNTGRRWTPFRATCEEVRKYVETHPGCSLKDCISNIKTHYSTPATARQCISKWVFEGKVEGVRAEMLGHATRLFPA